MIQLVGDRCYTDALSRVTESFRTGDLHDVIIRVTGDGCLIRRLERTAQVFAEIHGEVSEVLDDDYIVFVG